MDSESSSCPMSTHPFIYEPLPSHSSIRLLQRNGTAADGRLCFIVQIRDLECERVKYHCLSYTWGNPYADGVYARKRSDSVNEQYDASNRVPIYVNGRTLYIQKNLYDALSTVPETAYVEELNRTLERGQSYLHRAASKGLAEVIERRIRRGAKVDVIDDSGRIPLHYAAENGHLEAVDILCRADSLLTAQDENGKTPRELAAAGKHESIVQYLETAMEKSLSFEISTIVQATIGADDLIWADAICINQDDVDEKSAQVGIMDWIYSRATFVLAWLGPEDESTTTGLRTLKFLASHAEKFKHSEIVPYGRDDRKSFEAANIPFISWENWVALAGIFQRQWFKRSWIVQEAVLPDVLIVYCGRQKVSWSALGIVADGLRNQEARLGTSRSKVFVPADQVAVPVEWNMAEIYKWRTHMREARKADAEQASKFQSYCTLKTLVDCFWTFRATDPRDKIFSLSGILNVFAKERLETDYRQSVESVYTIAARQIMLGSGSLNVMSSCICSGERRPGLPSWVPDFSLPGVNGIPNLFSADSGLRYRQWKDCSLANPILSIRGHRLGSISDAADRPGLRPGEKFTFNPAWLKLALSLIRSERDESRSPISSILWRTLCMDLSYGGFFDASIYGPQAPDEFGHQFKILMMVMILASADSMVLKHFGIEKRPDDQEFAVVGQDYNPFDDLASTLAELDAIEAHDGDDNCLPTRLEVLTLWDSLRYTLSRLTRANSDGSPVDVHLPPEVIDGQARIVGNGTIEPESRLFSNCRSFATAYNVAYGGRKLITLDRRYLGLAPLSAKQGDEVWILPGLSVPAVLRRIDKRVEDGLSELSIDEAVAKYEFVGAAYIHGIMRGEAVGGEEMILEEITLI